MTSSPTASFPHVGTVLGSRYELLRHIARGGMGDVYEGEDKLLQRRVAVKVYRAASPADRARFDDEVRILASLNHPGLVRVFDAGPHGDDAYVVLELIDGPPLSECMADGPPLEPRRVAELGAELADALDYIHRHGVVHRDVTPANVLCDPEGRPRLVDFGIVRLLDSPRVTSASIAIGTAGYMAPEQVQGHDVTPAADVYSLGLLLLEALTGRHEFVGTVQEVAMARLVRDPDVHPGTPAGWPPLLGAMCARDPEQRPSAAEVRDQLRALAGGRIAATHAGATAAVALAGTALDQPTAPVPATAAGAVAEPQVSVDATVAVAMPVAGDGTTVIPAVTFAGAPTPPRRRRRASVWAVAGGIAAGLVSVLTVAALAAPEDEDTPTTETTVSTAPTTTTTLVETRAEREARVERTADTTPATVAPTTTTAPPPAVVEAPAPTVPPVVADPPAADPPADEAPAEDEETAAPAAAEPTG